MKWFGQTVLQVESCSMDAIMQIFKRSINPGTPLFESLSKKSFVTTDDLFKRVNKYPMLENDVQIASQQVLVTNRPTKNNEVKSSKFLNQSRQVSKRRASQQQQVRLTPLRISYERLISIIRDLLDFR